MSEWSIIWHVLVALGLGAIIGLERELKEKPAGIRTYMFVCGATALLTLLAGVIVPDYIASHGDNIRVDPLHLFEAIIVGISFIGAGVIMRAKDDVRNLTTSAAILFTAGIGIAVALDQFVIAGVLTGVVVLTLYLLGLFEARLLKPVVEEIAEGKEKRDGSRKR